MVCKTIILYQNTFCDKGKSFILNSEWFVLTAMVSVKIICRAQVYIVRISSVAFTFSRKLKQ